MAQPFSLTGRNREVLTAIVKAYIATGEPVGSRSISARRKDGLSPASVRNTMAELEAQGYLSHPHTSAGRVPTSKAFRHYVEHLGATRLAASEISYIQEHLGQATSIEERLGRSSQVLAALTQQVGIVVVEPFAGAVLEHVQFVPLADRRVLVVLVAKGEVVRHRVIHLAERISPGELERIANYLNQNFAGWKLAAVRREILRLIEQERAAFDLVLRRLRHLYLQGFLGSDSETQIYLEGRPNLVDPIQSLDAARLRRMLQALEDKQTLMALLDQCIQGDLTVRIGLEDTYPAMRDYALVGTPCGVGRIAVIGSTRMPYERVISAVTHLARLFHDLGRN